MGCALSKQDGEDDVLSLCGERKRLLKLALERRYAFADAQCKYNQSLYAVAMALRLFVARHSSPSTPFLITFPSSSLEPNETLISNPNPMFLQQRPSKPIHQTIECQTSDSTFSFSSSKLEMYEQESQKDHNSEDEKESDEEEESDGEGVCEHFFDEVGPQVSSPRKDFGWDFFNPFNEVRTEVVNGFSQSSEENLRVVREKEGIPELEEDEERTMSETEVATVNNGNVGKKESGVTEVRSGGDANAGIGESNSFRVVDAPSNGRELLEALKDIEDHFLRAYDSGLDVSRMLEANRVQLQSGLEEIKENSNKLIRSITWNRSFSSRSSITWNRSNSSRSSSSKSLLTSSSTSSSMWTESKNDIFDDYGMEAGSHSLTLGRLYAWEKKLFQEVKAGDQTTKIYERKCSHLRNQNVGDGLCSVDKSKAEVEGLYSRISVAIRSVESISERIEKLRDEELHPQILELLQGLMRNWKIMLECHETQNQVMLEVKSFNCPAYGKFCNDSHRLATLQLEAELDNWRSSFSAYISAQKAYIEALSGWLSKFVAPEVEFYFRGRSSAQPRGINGPPLLVTCGDWLVCLKNLPDEAVTRTMKSCGRDIHSLWSKQGEEQQQRRKVEGLAKEVDRKALAFQRAERRTLETKISEQETELSVRNRIEYLAERKNTLDMFRKRLDAETEEHITSMQQTKQITIHGLQMGFSSVFESLSEFSKAAIKMYAHLVTYGASAKMAGKNAGSLPDMDGMGYDQVPI